MACYDISYTDKAFSFCKFCNAMISWVESPKTGKKYPANVYPSNSDFKRHAGIHVVYTHVAHKCDDKMRQHYRELLGSEHPDNQQKTTTAPVEMKDVVEGKVTVEGVIVSFKTVDSGFGETVKMLVQCDGYRVYGTCPKALDEAQAGDKVQFNATVTKSNKDASFGTYSRPTKASIIK